MVPHSLNEQKCIGELVRAGCECLWGLRWRQVCTHIALSVPSRVLRPCTPFSTKQSPSLIFPASAPWLIIAFQDPQPHTKVQLEDLVRVLVMPATLPQKSKKLKKKKPTPLNVHMAEAHLQTPPVLCGNKKKNLNKKQKQNCTHRYPCGL